MKIWMIRRKNCAMRWCNLGAIFDVDGHVDHCRCWLRRKDAQRYLDSYPYPEPFEVFALIPEHQKRGDAA